MKFFTVVLLAALPLSAFAHHSRAEFTGEVEAIEAELVSARWVNPHPQLELRVISESGTEELLRIQVFGSARSLRQAGVTEALFDSGDDVTIVGRRSERREGVILGTNLLLADGREVLLDHEAEPYWTGDYIGGMEAFIAGGSQLVDAATENRGIFRVWSPPAVRNQGETRYAPLTEAAAAASAQVDPFQTSVEGAGRVGPNPEVGMPEFMFHSVLRFELRDQGDAITIHKTGTEVFRTIHMRPPVSFDDEPLSDLGFSIGQREGNVLEVETRRISWPFYNHNTGIPISTAVRIIERFTLSDDQTRLDYHMTIIDPENFTEPATYEKYWTALDAPLEFPE